LSAPAAVLRVKAGRCCHPGRRGTDRGSIGGHCSPPVLPYLGDPPHSTFHERL